MSPSAAWYFDWSMWCEKAVDKWELRRAMCDVAMHYIPYLQTLMILRRLNTRQSVVARGVQEVGFTQPTPELMPHAPAEPVCHIEAVPPRLTRAQARRLNTGFRVENDALPEAPMPLDPLPPPPNATMTPTPQTKRHTQTNARAQNRRHPQSRLPFRTEPDTFGRYRVYQSRPQTIPDAEMPMAHALPATELPNPSRCPRPLSDIIAPCPNISVFYVLRYHWLNGNNKSLDDRDYLCNEVLLQPDFNPRDLIGVNLREVDSQLAEAAKSWDPNCPPAQGWKNVPLRLRVPPPRITQAQSAHSRNLPVETYVTISGYRARSLVDVMTKTFATNNPTTFHYEPFEHRWKPPGSSRPGQTLSGEMYTSPAMRRAHREVQDLDIECTLPRCVAGFMFASDGMQFAQFSHVKGWPILCSFGNESKYERCKPTSNTCFQVAHIPTLPDEVQEQIAQMHGGKPPTDALLTHLRRELMHAVWSALLDDDIVHAWKHGVVIQCADGIVRRVFPRILTYSADYPEKVLLATIRNLGDCLCPRCLVHKASASQMGTPTDMRIRKKQRIDNEKRRGKVERARQFIYEQGRTIQSKPVEDLLKSESYVPTMNAFSDRLHDCKFNIFSSLVVDQLHEIELGVWKSLFLHLIRLLHHNGSQAVTEFNRRFRLVPTFASTIRMFAEDVASVGRIAARDFEDILQCCMPVFEGLLPEICDQPAQRLLFLFAEWHGLVKLRLHTTDTLKILKSLTTKLGTALRNFAKLTAAMDVRETPKEYARRRKQAEMSKAASMTRRVPAKSTHTTKKPESAPNGDGRQICLLNLNTYKMHSCGDYPWSIEEYGTTDSFSTQIGELQNRKIKAQYLRTNKRGAVEQMTRINDIITIMEDMDKELQEFRNEGNQVSFNPAEAVNSLVGGSPYFIGLRDRSEDVIPNIASWVTSQPHEDAVKFFLPQLKKHLLGRVLGTPNCSDFSALELAQLEFQKGRMYRHKTLRINYTSYDVLRQQDVLNASTPHCFTLLPTESQQDTSGDHPFVYAKVLGVYHAHIIYCNRPPSRMDFVHVRWMYYDYDQCGGWGFGRLDRVTYLLCLTNNDVLDSFDFINPSNILRAIHLIPDFCSGTTKEFFKVPQSIAHDDKVYGDWKGYYVNRFVDRDMLMRYIGGGVGHYRQTLGTAVDMNEIEELDIPEGDGGGADESEAEDGDIDVHARLERFEGADSEEEDEEGFQEAEPGYSDLEEEGADDYLDFPDDLYGF
ncbi:hypothetical protein FRC06_001569 [Ceratobasidium sp. 370]|nr:hypothetical protein FRC06_001569 [Ceratobasidium sp. 370]